MASKALTHQDYSVGWVCALTKELVAATIMLDKKHPDLPIPASDQNTYTLGSIGNHNIAIACLPKGEIGNNPAATVATRMTSTFPLIRFWLMVGIAGGVPPKVRLGDIVVSTPLYDHPGVVQWDLGIAQQEKCFRRTEVLYKAPDVLRTAVTKLKTQHDIHGSEVDIMSILENVQAKQPRLSAKYLRSDRLQDVLFRADYEHVSQNPQKGDEKESIDGNEEDGDEDDTVSCRYCDRTRVVQRRPRTTKIQIHYGLVASGNAVIKNAQKREEINQQRLEGLALCFEMKAAGITNNHPCLVIRGICGESF